MAEEVLDGHRVDLTSAQAAGAVPEVMEAERPEPGGERGTFTRRRSAEASRRRPSRLANT